MLRSNKLCDACQWLAQEPGLSDQKYLVTQTEVMFDGLIDSSTVIYRCDYFHTLITSIYSIDSAGVFLSVSITTGTQKHDHACACSSAEMQSLFRDVYIRLRFPRRN